GGSALIAWSGPNVNPDILARRILADGTLLDPLQGFAISNAPNGQFLPSISWDGSQYLLDWTDHRNETFPIQPRGDIYGARVDVNGNVLDPVGFAIANSPLPEDTPTVVASNGLGIFAYAAFNPTAPFGTLRIRLRTTGTIVPTGATHFSVVAANSSTAGNSINLTVTALDALGNTATGYTGKIHFTSTDGQAVLPADYTFLNTDNG